MDTGSTWTFIPRNVAEDQHLPEATPQYVPFVNGGETYQARFADISIYGREIGRRVLIFKDDAPEAIIGRDVLETIALVFDGPAKEWRLID